MIDDHIFTTEWSSVKELQKVGKKSGEKGGGGKRGGVYL